MGTWDLFNLVGQGRLAAVYRARPAGAGDGRGASYAVKLLRRRWHRNQAAIDCWRREAAVGREVSHPHLVSILSAHAQQLPYYLVMPLLRGGALRRRLDPPLRPSVTMALCYARQTAEALGALHEKGWMHADVKPSNVFVSPEGHVTLMDLGFARRVDEERSTAGRVVLGTANYLAPEMITSVWAADIRSDIYSLGVMLFEMLSGRLPFTGRDLAEIVRRHKQTSPPELRRLAPWLPVEASHLVRRMLAKDPLRRPQTPCELVRQLAALEIATCEDRQPTIY